MHQQPTEGVHAVWSPCTNGRTIASYLARLQLPATYQDIRERWKSLGSPALDTLIRHSAFDREHRGHDGDLDTVIAGQKEFLTFTLNTFSTLGIVLPKRKFEDVALYIHVRAEIEAELDVREYGWSDPVKDNLYQAYWRRSLSSAAIDYAPCRAATCAHTCLYHQVWGEMGSMTPAEVYSQFENLYGAAGGPTSSSVTSSWSTSTSSPSGGPATTTESHVKYAEELCSSPMEGFEISDAPSLANWKTTHPSAIHPSFCDSLGTRSDPAQEEILAVLTKELLQFAAASPRARDDGDLSLLQAGDLQAKPKRQRIHRRATSDTVSQGRSTSKGRRRPLCIGDAFIGDMMARFADTYDRFDKSGVAEASIHIELGKIFSLEIAGATSEDRNTTLLSPKRTKRASKRVRSSDEGQLSKISRIANILNTLSEELSNSRSVVELGARDIQRLTMSSVLRYQHALLDTWHLYRERWAYLIESERRLSVSPTQDSPVVRPIATLIHSLSAEQKTTKKDDAAAVK